MFDASPLYEASTMRTSSLNDKQQALRAQQRAFLRRSTAILTHSDDYDQAHAAWLAASAQVEKIADDIRKGLRY
jgi:hypothetical protein